MRSAALLMCFLSTINVVLAKRELASERDRLSSEELSSLQMQRNMSEEVRQQMIEEIAARNKAAKLHYPDGLPNPPLKTHKEQRKEREQIAAQRIAAQRIAAQRIAAQREEEPMR